MFLRLNRHCNTSPGLARASAPPSPFTGGIGEECAMTRPIIAVTDSPFPSLDPVKAALAQLDPDIRMAKSTSADDILAVARDADAVIVCYAQITGADPRRAHALQGDRAHRARRRQYRRAGRRRARHRGDLRAGLLPARSVRPRHGAAAGAGAQDHVRQQARAVRPLGAAADRAAAAAGRAGAGPDRLRQHPARGGAEGEGVRAHGDRARSLCGEGRARVGRRRGRELRRPARALRLHLGACAADCRRRAA